MTTCRSYHRDCASLAREQRGEGVRIVSTFAKNAVISAVSGARYCISAPLGTIRNGRPAHVATGDSAPERTKTMTRILTPLALILALAPRADAALKDEPEVFNRLLQTAIAHEIRDKCPTIDAREWAATMYVLGIVRVAQSLGYSMDEINAYKADEGEQDRLRAATHAYLDANGVNRDDPASYCPLGLAEIDKRSQIGKLLKSR
jgi:hypothetical protein